MNNAHAIARRLLEDDVDPKDYAMSMPQLWPGCIMARCTVCGVLRGDVDPGWLQMLEGSTVWDCEQCNKKTFHTLIRPVSEDNREDEFDPKKYVMNLSQPAPTFGHIEWDGGLDYHSVYVKGKLIGYVSQHRETGTWHVVCDLRLPFHEQFDTGPDNVRREYATKEEAAQAAVKLRCPI